ncbi:RNA dependent RNA polymerase-domain-containing protein [Russula compacta]|nr:RNA dependent RNA polymerase-domain-containing protein [Russula compacta]
MACRAFLRWSKHAQCCFDALYGHFIGRPRTTSSLFSYYIHVLPGAQSTFPPHSPPAHVSPPQEGLPFLSGKFALPRHTICHSADAQQCMERLKISWGVQYELARGVLAKNWTWNDVTTDVLERLRGSHADAAPRVQSVMGKRTHCVNSDIDLWKEYDREQDAILEGTSRGLGLRGEWKGVPDWFGGRIEQVVRLSKSNGTFSYRLDRPGLQKSTRFARFLGSRRILKLKLSKDLQYESAEVSGVRDYLSYGFVLCGRVFVPFASKGGSAYMMEVNEDQDRKPDSAQGDGTRISLWDFVQWHNPLVLNRDQPMSKWSTRFELGLSKTVPIIQFEPGNINFILDETPHDEREGVSSEVLTDGCGFINGAALTLIARRLGLPSRPTAVQGRVAGAKGLWILHCNDRSQTEPPRIWIRKSQKKVNLTSLEESRAHVIFDLVAQSTRIVTPGHLNRQTIINLAENGVDSQVLQDLLHEGLNHMFTSLTQWNGPGAMPLLWSTVNNLGGVTRTHLQRVAHGIARAIGLANRFEVDLEDEDDDDDPEDERSSGDDDKPLYQAVLELIQAGFNPQSSPFLYEKMQWVVTMAMERYLKKYRFEVRQSAEAFIVPDPFGVLEEGEIHFRSSQELGDPLTETNVYSVRGPVLVSRNPTMVASDIQKVEAVEYEQLADYINVIVFSTKGSRSLASLLAGGGSSSLFLLPLVIKLTTGRAIRPDYDGDTVMVNWAPSVVEKFKPSKVVEKPDGFEKKYFVEHVERVQNFCDFHRHSNSDKTQIQKSLLLVMLRGLDEAYVGNYSKFHSYAVYTKGYSDKETIRLAYMFTTCLDSKKTGHRVLASTFSQDSKQYGRGLPDCMRSDEETSEWNQSGLIRRPEALGPFVLDSLRNSSMALAGRFLTKYEQLSSQSGVSRFATADLDLLRPHQQIVEKLSQMESRRGVNSEDFIREANRELRMIEDHVQGLSSRWPSIFRKKSRSVQTREKAALRQSFVTGPDVPNLSLLGDVPAIRASYAYKKCNPKSPSFAFAMAFEDLCNIKARESGGTTLERGFVELMAIPKTAVRTLSALRSQTV